MSTFDRPGRLQRELPDILTEIAAPRVPDYVDDILAETAVIRQRPRWTFAERWLPMGVLARQRTLFPSVPWRLLVTIAVLLAVVAAALLIAGSRQRVPPPFGVARSGAVGLEANGDILIRDTIDGASRAVVTGPTDDFAPGFTRDGTRLTFLRRTSGTAGTPSERLAMVVANVDGSNPTVVSPPLIAPDWSDISPDDSYVVVAAGDPSAGQQLYRVDLQHPGEPTRIDFGKTMTASTPNFRGPDGREILFRGTVLTDGTWRTGLFAARPDGSGLRPITPTNGGAGDYLFPQPSPDGRWLVYTKWDSVIQRNHLRRVDLETGEDQPVTTNVLLNDGFATVSPDSTQILFVRYFGDRNQLMLGPIDGTARARAMGPAYPMVQNDYLAGMFAPDGTTVVVNDPASKETRRVSVATGGDGVIVPGGLGTMSGWQRLAP